MVFPKVNRSPALYKASRSLDPARYPGGTGVFVDIKADSELCEAVRRLQVLDGVAKERKALAETVDAVTLTDDVAHRPRARL